MPTGLGSGTTTKHRTGRIVPQKIEVGQKFSSKCYRLWVEPNPKFTLNLSPGTALPCGISVPRA